MSEYNPMRPGAQQVSSDLFGFEPPAEPGLLRVAMPTPCLNCTRNIATIGPGKGPHKASLRCSSCMRFRGWMSHEAFNRICVRAATDGGGEGCPKNQIQKENPNV